MSPAITVVLPVLNEEQDIGSLLDTLTGQDPVPGGSEVLVVDGGSTDATVSIAAGFSSCGVQVLHNKARISSAGRNVGASAARGRYVVFLDGHCIVPRSDYLRRVHEIFVSTGADCLARPQPLDRVGEDDWSKAIATARHSRLGHNPGSDIYGGREGFTDPQSAGAAYTRACIEKLGGYDERFDACEDVEFNYRVAEAGLRAYVHPDLAIYYRPRSTLRGLLVQMIRYGRGRARLFARHPRAVPWPLLAITGYLFTAVVLTLFDGGGPRGVAWIPLGLLPLTAMGEGLRLGGVSVQSVRIAAALLVVYGGLTLGFWRGLFEYWKYRWISASRKSAVSWPADAGRAGV